MPRSLRRRQKKILLADDHQPTRNMFSQILREKDYRTVHATNGEEAYTRACFERPDLILMDLMMPVMDGYEALAKLKEDPLTESIKVMMLTSSDCQVNRHLALELGAAGYLVKPVRIDELERKIRLAIG